LAWVFWSYLQVHDGAAEQRDGQKYRTGRFEDLQLAVLRHVADEQQRRNHASTAYCQQGDSGEEKTRKIERILSNEAKIVELKCRQ
jgi:hypothetical protein